MYACGQLVREYVFDQSQRDQLLESHNTLRSLEPASNMQELAWDEGLAKSAMEHARRCDAWHSKSNTRRHRIYSYIGENIWWSNDKTLRKNLRSAMLEFYDEKKFYFFGQNVCAKGKMCLHYTQFVWATTCAVGCAATHCDSIKHGRHISRGHVIVCHYGEGGNEYGNRPYLPGAKCSHCPSGSTCTSKGLCSSTCTSPAHPFLHKFASPPTTSVPPPSTTTSHAETTSPSGDCRDRRAVCVQWARTGNCQGAQRRFMARFCASSCGLCATNITTEAPKSRNVASAVEPACRDLFSQKRCERDRALGHCRSPRTIGSMLANCKKTCGFCGHERKEERHSTILPTKAVLTCRDMYRSVECGLLKERGHCKNPRLRRAMNERCAKTCDLCDARRKL
uniref:ShKT domain-containing protein n=1 Tax=Steinernema glaseri TaxID=37863 RepID=A0A1I7ZXE5_9BILA